MEADQQRKRQDQISDAPHGVAPGALPSSGPPNAPRLPPNVPPSPPPALPPSNYNLWASDLTSASQTRNSSHSGCVGRGAGPSVSRRSPPSAPPQTMTAHWQGGPPPVPPSLDVSQASLSQSPRTRDFGPSAEAKGMLPTVEGRSVASPTGTRCSGSPSSASAFGSQSVGFLDGSTLPVAPPVPQDIASPHQRAVPLSVADLFGTIANVGLPPAEKEGVDRSAEGSSTRRPGSAIPGQPSQAFGNFSAATTVGGSPPLSPNVATASSHVDAPNQMPSSPTMQPNPLLPHARRAYDLPLDRGAIDPARAAYNAELAARGFDPNAYGLGLLDGGAYNQAMFQQPPLFGPGNSHDPGLFAADGGGCGRGGRCGPGDGRELGAYMNAHAALGMAPYR
eukprot:TRINITY_DN74177_c0_g1_i1.p1 TRINITY_DN74177_c0_g1~~TRINITY_DN74177_c0_g1_i1.p1  ORF type:complete len:439 (+),score=53.46 TRINITY_DN74177_c0_g1_i1:139-1317(+)